MAQLAALSCCPLPAKERKPCYTMPGANDWILSLGQRGGWGQGLCDSGQDVILVTKLWPISQPSKAALLAKDVMLCRPHAGQFGDKSFSVNVAVVATMAIAASALRPALFCVFTERDIQTKGQESEVSAGQAKFLQSYQPWSIAEQSQHLGLSPMYGWTPFHCIQLCWHCFCQQNCLQRNGNCLG